MKKLLLAALLCFAVASRAGAVTFSQYTGTMTRVSVAGEAWYSDPVLLGLGPAQVSISGGTGTIHALFYYGDGSNLTNLGPSSALTGGGAGKIPYQTSAGVTAFLPAIGAGGIITGSATGAIPSTGTLTGTANQVIVTQTGASFALSGPQNLGTGNSPTFAGITLSAANTVPNGGTGVATLAQNGIVYGNAANPVGILPQGATAVGLPSLVYLNGAAGPSTGTISAGSNITMSYSATGLTIAAVGGSTGLNFGLFNSSQLFTTNGNFTSGSSGLIFADCHGAGGGGGGGGTNANAYSGGGGGAGAYAGHQTFDVSSGTLYYVTAGAAGAAGVHGAASTAGTAGGYANVYLKAGSTVTYAAGGSGGNCGGTCGNGNGGNGGVSGGGSGNSDGVASAGGSGGNASTGGTGTATVFCAYYGAGGTGGAGSGAYSPGGGGGGACQTSVSSGIGGNGAANNSAVAGLPGALGAGGGGGTGGGANASDGGAGGAGYCVIYY